MSDERAVRFDLDQFAAIQNGSWRPKSAMLAVLPADVESLAPFTIIERGKEVGIEFEQVESEDKDTLAFVAGGVTVLVTALTIRLDLGDQMQGGSLTPELKEAVEASTLGITVEITLGEPVLEQYHQALRLIYSVAPDAIAVHDEQKVAWISVDWLRRAVESQAPPPPSSLYTIHVVTDGDGPVWMHTHGLPRCGAIDLEVLDLDQDAHQAIGHLMRAAAALLIERGTPDEEDPFTVGKDMDVVWRRWDRVAEMRPKDVLGGWEDREGHDGLVGSLFVQSKKRRFLRRQTHWSSVSEFVGLIDDNPIFYVSNMETRRMAMLASEHFPLFRRVHGRFREDEAWRFLVKLGYQVDGEEDDPDRESEHLWFDVHAIDGARVDATLLNQPYFIDRMDEGQRGWHAIDQLSDWSVMTDERSYGPDGVHELVQDTGLE